jgi:hypothetical protein
MKTLKNITLITASMLLILTSSLASDKEAMSNNSISYHLANGSVEIQYQSIQGPSEVLDLEILRPAIFDFSKNMTVNGKHINKGQYEVRPLNVEDGVVFNFHPVNDKTLADTQVKLVAGEGQFSEWLNYSLAPVEDDKLLGEFNWKEAHYIFSMEIALSNTLFSYLEKEEEDHSSDWLDYYQVAIYSYKNNINLNSSYKWAQKALKKEQNEYTMDLNRKYIEALNKDNSAQQLSALQD